MSATIKHNFVSTKSDGEDTSLVRPSNWNETHIISGYETGQILFGNMLQDSGLFWDNTSKRLGIGTITPQRQLVVSNAGNVGIEFATSGGLGSGDGGTCLVTYDRAVGTSSPFTIYTKELHAYIYTIGEVLTINSSGYVGIGTTSPHALLEISKNYTGIACPLLITNPHAQALDYGEGFIFYGDSGLWQMGSIASAWEHASDKKSYIKFSVCDNGTENKEKMRIASNGNVGIGDPSPGELLDVAGNVDLTGVLKIDDVQVVSNRVIDSNIGNTIESAFTTLYPDASALLGALRTLITTHGLGAAS